MKTDPHWQKIGKKSHHGVCIPLFSLKSQTSCGIGEYLDLIPLIHWCKKIGLDCIQLLPLNDTGADPSPYNPLSSLALSPIYLSLHELGIDITPFAQLNNEPRLLRETVRREKINALQKHFDETFAALSRTDSYQAFVEEHRLWLDPYARFKAIKRELQDMHWKDWPHPLPNLLKEEIDFYKFLQYHCFRQMQKVKKEAEESSLFLKGDVPVLLSMDSVDVWRSPDLFHLDIEAGAPSDDFCQEAQIWGFPLLRWDEMKKNGYEWWKERMALVEKLYHIYRIDHAIGFFRIWGVPKGKTAREGRFFPPDPTEWVPSGKEHLEALLSVSPLLPIAEDLGTIFQGMRDTLKELGICGTKVMRWEFEKDRFTPLNAYEPYSMTTVSTIDLEPLGLWWKKHPVDASIFAEFMGAAYDPILSAPLREKILKASHQTSSMFHINLLSEYLALFPELVWLNPEDERINLPGTTIPTNWTYRFRPFLEEILSHEGLFEALQRIL